MRILVFNWRDLKHIWAGGGEVYIFENASRWVKMGHEVIIFCGQDVVKDLPSYEEINGIKIYRKGGRYTLYLWAIWYYFTRLRKNADIIVDVENGIPFFTPLFSRKPKVCIVHHVHGKQFFYELPFPHNYIGFFIERIIFPIVYRNTSLIAVSLTTKKELMKMGFSNKKIEIVYNGLNGIKNRKKENVIKYLNPTILYLGRIKKYKRVDLLVNIFPKILKKIPNSRLIIAGWGTEALNITDLIMRNDLRRRIILRGPVSNTEKKLLLSKSWVFVNPSIGEGWSIAVIEANYHGTPAIAFKVPGLTESIKHGETGLLGKDENDLIDKICLFLTNHTLREKLSRNAKIWAASFSWDRSAKKTITVIERLRKNT